MVHESRAPVASSAGMRGSIVRRGGARVDVGGEELGGDEVSQVVEPDMAEAEPVAERCSPTKAPGQCTCTHLLCENS